MKNEQTQNAWRYLLDGMVAVDYAAHLFVEEYKLFMDVFNGSTPEGYALDRYQKAFSYSFDEEVPRMESFVDEVIKAPKMKSLFMALEPLHSEGNVVIGLLGFELMKIALDQLDEARKTDDTDAWQWKHIEETEDIANPFQDKTFYQFHTAVDGWTRAFSKELKDRIGRRAYDKKKKQALEYAEKWVTTRTLQ